MSGSRFRPLDAFSFGGLDEAAGNGVSVTTTHGDGRVEQTIDLMGQISRRVADVAAMQADAAFRAELIKLGWTPPTGKES